MRSNSASAGHESRAARHLPLRHTPHFLPRCVPPRGAIGYRSAHGFEKDSSSQKEQGRSRIGPQKSQEAEFCSDHNNAIKEAEFCSDYDTSQKEAEFCSDPSAISSQETEFCKASDSPKTKIETEFAKDSENETPRQSPRTCRHIARLVDGESATDEAEFCSAPHTRTKTETEFEGSG